MILYIIKEIRMFKMKLRALKAIKARPKSKKENGIKINADKGKYLKSHR
jgi:hypothetical protein